MFTLLLHTKERWPNRLFCHAITDFSAVFGVEIFSEKHIVFDGQAGFLIVKIEVSYKQHWKSSSKSGTNDEDSLQAIAF